MHQPPDAVFGALALVIWVGSRLPVVCVAPAKGASILRADRAIVIYHSYLVRQIRLVCTIARLPENLHKRWSCS